LKDKRESLAFDLVPINAEISLDRFDKEIKPIFTPQPKPQTHKLQMRRLD